MRDKDYKGLLLSAFDVYEEKRKKEGFEQLYGVKFEEGVDAVEKWIKDMPDGVDAREYFGKCFEEKCDEFVREHYKKDYDVRTMFIALKMASVAGAMDYREQYDFGFGPDSDEMCRMYLEWAETIKDCYGKEDYYDVVYDTLVKELDAYLGRPEMEEDMDFDEEEEEYDEDEIEELSELSLEEKIERLNSLQESVGKRLNELHDLNLEVSAELINKVLRTVDESKKLEDILSNCHFNHWDTHDLHKILEQYSYHLNAIGQNDISHCYDVDVKLTKNAMVCFHKYFDDTVMQDLSSIGVFNDKGEHLGFFGYAELKQMEKELEKEEKGHDKKEVMR